MKKSSSSPAISVAEIYSSAFSNAICAYAPHLALDSSSAPAAMWRDGRAPAKSCFLCSAASSMSFSKPGHALLKYSRLFRSFYTRKQMGYPLLSQYPFKLSKSKFMRFQTTSERREAGSIQGSNRSSKKKNPYDQSAHILVSIFFLL